MLVALTGIVTVETNSEPASAATVTVPQVYKFQAFTNRIDDLIDELRADFVLKVPHGYVHPTTGALQTVDGRQLKVGYDYGDGARRDMTYLNTLAGAAGANAWAHNQDEYFTVHKVISSGDNDYLVISIEGDMNIPDGVAANNVVGGRAVDLNWYFSFSASGGTAWIPSALTVYPATYYFYYGSLVAGNRTGPQIGMQWDSIYNFWSNRQANWGQVLDFGLNGHAAGVLPPNSVAVDLINKAYSSTASGPAGSVSDSFWYAWVHEDGSLVTSINTAPIRITGVPPSSASNRPTSSVSKNTPSSGGPTLAYTAAQGAQGLTTKVGADGAIDFTDAGGTGYYRLLVWPESRNPTTVTADNGAPQLSYTPADLFDGNGHLTPLANSAKWTAATTYYRYDIPLPPAPVIEEPAPGSYTNVNDTVTLSGTGEPGSTISLKLKAGDSITNTRDPALTVVKDGDHEDAQAGDIVVDASGNWTYTYTPATPLVDGPYTVFATQTDQTAGGYYLTSPPSNPDDPGAPTAWGVTFIVDTTPPVAPAFTCHASPTDDVTPTFTGGGVEAGATVRIHQGSTHIGDATVDGSTWSYTVSPALTNGQYTFTVTQVDRAGNESPASAPPCALQIATPVTIEGVKVIEPVTDGDPALAAAAPVDWEITSTEGGTSTVISGGADVQLERETTYTIGERLVPAPASNAFAYAQKGQVACVDGDGDALPNDVFDATTGAITVGPTDVIAEPITCTVTNQTAHATLWTARIGGQTVAPPAGWSLTAANADADFDFALDTATTSREVRPSDYDLTADLPYGLSLVGVEKLDLAQPDCAALANTADTAPQTCWIPAVDEEAAAQGAHNVYRIVAATPADMPSLPVTGGLGAWLFTAGGIGALVIALAFQLLRRFASRAISPAAGATS